MYFELWNWLRSYTRITVGGIEIGGSYDEVMMKLVNA